MRYVLYEEMAMHIHWMEEFQQAKKILAGRLNLHELFLLLDQCRL